MAAAHVQASGPKAAALVAKQVLNARLRLAFLSGTGRHCMDFDEDDNPPVGLTAAVPLPPEDWERLGRTDRFRSIYADHHSQVRRYFKGRASSQDIGDLVQEVFSRFTSRGAFASLVERPGAYLVKSARMLLAERARADDRHQRPLHHSFEESDAPTSDPHDALEARDALRRAEEVISGLSPRTREIFLLHRLDDLSYPEIARIKGLSVKTVESHMSKALVAIRRAGRYR
ncbi:RNA polymerase sigma factor [Sphingopyxis panaciterrae]